MSEVKVWEETVKIPTYEIGSPQKIPMFLDKRVYQGSCGKVYPYPVVEKIADKKVDKEYKGIYLENEFLKVLVLPELGGRIQRAYDKTNGYDFVYYNHVIKPALVGLTGPWISGGIEFNWPQHHRPTTFLPVDHMMVSNDDGSKSILVHDVDQMYGTKGIAKITLYPGKSYIEITGQLYNRTPLPQTFLWWANPAVPVNDHTQSIFPPDVHAVMDHGKRDVSRFPIATGIYYKKDYSDGVDISRYKNIPVPTSYMAEKSDYDFVGGYDYGVNAGILHVADHHISPGKKQWTWGCGDFGKAWDRNLTDADGPYIELMTGVYTDNQPDFTWLKPFEEKTFKQYFMPYKTVGQVKNACTDAAMNLSIEKNMVKICVYGTSKQSVKIQLTYDGETIFSQDTVISPIDIFEKKIAFTCEDETKLTLSLSKDDRELLSYTAKKEEIEKLPDPAEAITEPETIGTVEELYLAGLHIEQYRHATYLPDPYYLEALKRDPLDIRSNTAYGMLLLRRGCFKEAKSYFKTALKRMTRRNPNPYSSEAYYDLGLAQFYLGEKEDAYDAFYKATWSNEQQEMSFFYLAVLDVQNGKYESALSMIEKALVKNAHNIKARGLKAYILRKLNKTEDAKEYIKANLTLDPFDFMSEFEFVWMENDADEKKERYRALMEKMRDFPENYHMIARDYAQAGAYKEALEVLAALNSKTPLTYYYEAFYNKAAGNDMLSKECLQKAEEQSPDCCFPNKLEDIAVLNNAIEQLGGSMAAYYLGNLYYDKMQWDKAGTLWEQANVQYPKIPAVHRNLSLYYYNHKDLKEEAKVEMEKAFALDTSDSRIFLELDQLYKKLNVSFKERLVKYEEHRAMIEERDDLMIEYITLLNMTGAHKEAYELLLSRRFHPWEGGEGKVTTQYTIALVELAKEAMQKTEYDLALSYLQNALSYPENLGEGKLEGTKDNHIYYLLGICKQKLGMEKEAKECFENAEQGTDEPAGVLFYNDQPADMILYQGLAKAELKKNAEAKSRFYRLIDYGEQHVYDSMKIPYFAVSLPDFLIFKENYTVKNEAHCYYLMGLGNWGLGNCKKALNYFKKALELEPSHMQCNIYYKELSRQA